MEKRKQRDICLVIHIKLYIQAVTKINQRELATNNNYNHLWGFNSQNMSEISPAMLSAETTPSSFFAVDRKYARASPRESW